MVPVTLAASRGPSRRAWRRASSVYALETGPDGKGDRITVVNPDGTIRSGWPKTLQRAGATWDSVTIGDNRVGLRCRDRARAGQTSRPISILAFAPNGIAEWISTLVEP